jgi:hypothetical protein
VAGAVDVFLLEGAGGQAHELGGALEVGPGQIDETLLIAAVDASSLACETKRIQALIVPYLVPKLLG